MKAYVWQWYKDTIAVILAKSRKDALQKAKTYSGRMSESVSKDLLFVRPLELSKVSPVYINESSEEDGRIKELEATVEKQEARIEKLTMMIETQRTAEDELQERLEHYVKKATEVCITSAKI